MDGNDQDFQIDFTYKITKCNTHTNTDIQKHKQKK